MIEVTGVHRCVHNVVLRMLYKRLHKIVIMHKEMTYFHSCLPNQIVAVYVTLLLLIIMKQNKFSYCLHLPTFPETKRNDWLVLDARILTSWRHSAADQGVQVLIIVDLLWNVFVILTVYSTFSGGIICRLRATIITTFLKKQPLLQSWQGDS